MIIAAATIALFMAISPGLPPAFRSGMLSLYYLRIIVKPFRSPEMQFFMWTQHRAVMVRLTHAQASAVPIPAPITPNLGIRSALKITSNTHMIAFRILGVTMFSAALQERRIQGIDSENGTISA